MKLRRIFTDSFSLKKQLLIYFVIVSFIPACIISIYFYNNSKKLLEKSMGESNYRFISGIVDNLDSKVKQVSQFTNIIYTDRGVVDLLLRKSEDADKFDKVKGQVIGDIERQFQYQPITGYINSMFILGENGLDLRNGAEAFLIDKAKIKNSEWYNKGRQSNGDFQWWYAVKNYAGRHGTEYVIPMYRVMNDLNTGQKRGDLILLFSASFFEDCYSNTKMGSDEELYIIADDGTIIFSNNYGLLGKKIEEGGLKISQLKDAYIQNFEVTIGKEKKLVTYKKSTSIGWKIIHIYPLTEIQKQRRVILSSTLLLVAILILLSMSFSVFLSENFARPIKRLVKQVNLVAQGQFDSLVTLKSQNEIGELGRNIEKMAKDIRNLLNEVVLKEEEKRKFEIKMLQSQINPHFLYNTLNSIKWMASLQGADGIRDMVSSLGRLLKSALNDSDEKITIREELAILEDYFYIQHIRYKGKVKFRNNAQSDALLDNLILKFTLQPLVENSVFHGLEPMEEPGEIVLSVEEGNQCIIIIVEDNGVGMDSEKISQIMNDDGKGFSMRGFRGIGLGNVNRRIKLEFGEQYGLTLESELGKYTKAKVCLPIMTVNDGKVVSNNRKVDQIEGIDC